MASSTTGRRASSTATKTDRSIFYLPQESLRYGGPVAVLVGPNCVSACEYFSYAATLDGRSDAVGYYAHGGRRRWRAAVRHA